VLFVCHGGRPVAGVAPVEAQASFSSASGQPPPPPLPPGSSQANPVYPNTWQWSTASGVQYYASFNPSVANLIPPTQWYSTTVESGGLWLSGIDSMRADLFGSSFFTYITAPEGFGSMTLSAGNSVLDSDFTAGEVFTFFSRVTSFKLALNSPTSFPAGSPAANSFQLRIGIEGAPSAMTWLFKAAAPVPETSTFALTLLGLMGLGMLTTSARRKSS
jgi:hypothetical protein